MHRILLIVVSAAVGVVAGYFGPKLVACIRPASPTLLPFPTFRPQRQNKRGRVTGVQSTDNVADFSKLERDDR